MSPILGLHIAWAEINLHTPGDRMTVPWPRHTAGRVRRVNHCFIEGERCLYQKTQKKIQEVKCSQLLPGSGGSQGVCTWPGTKSVSNLLDWEFSFEKSTSRDLWELSSSAPGQKINGSEDQQGKPSKSEAPCLWLCGLTGGNVAGCASLQGAWGLHSLCLRRSNVTEKEKSSTVVLKTAGREQRWKSRKRYFNLKKKKVNSKARNKFRRETNRKQIWKILMLVSHLPT